MNNGTIEPLGWVEVERAKEPNAKLTVNFEYLGYPCSLELEGGSLDLIMKLPEIAKRLERADAERPGRAFAGAEGVAMPRSGSKVPLSALSQREYEVLVRTVNGKTYPQIGLELGITEKTVSTFITRIRVRLGIDDRYGLIWYAAEHGLLEDRETRRE